MISLLFIAIAAILNSFMDRIENENWNQSIFYGWNERFWYKRISWKYAKKIFSYKLDAWHLAKSLMIICFAFAVILYQPIWKWWIDFLIIGVVWNAVFNVFYNRVFKKKQ